MAELSFLIDRDGVEETVTVDVSFDATRFGLREMVRIEDALGPNLAERFLEGTLPVTPKTIQAVLWAKLATQVPDLELDDFDLPVGAIGQFGRDHGDDLIVPMTEDVTSSQ